MLCGVHLYTYNYTLLSGTIHAKLMHHKAPVRCPTVSNDGTLLISGAGDQTFAVINLITCQFTHNLMQNESDAGTKVNITV